LDIGLRCFDLSDKLILGVDAGGTFTDFVLYRLNGTQSEIKVHKVLSTPDAPEKAILQGISELGLGHEVESGELQVVHGSTVATNAALEGKGVLTAFVTNHGFADMLTIGRQTRPSLYQLELESEISKICAFVKTHKPQAVAINLLFSFVDPVHEHTLRNAINALGLPAYVCCSADVLPEYKEYERGIATWLNASLGPVVSGYLTRLDERLSKCRLMIMQSSGETITARIAAERAVNLLLSGPAAGLAAINHLGGVLGQSKFLSFDMGGTSTDVALIDGALRITNEGSIADLPVAVPMVEMQTIGAGGGSIAFVDAGGMLQVGPQSAGADPGPACYGRGATQATVTDANLILCRIKADMPLAGNLQLDFNAGYEAIASLANEAELTVEEVAQGIVSIANEHMASALRLISVQRGYDPSEFILASFGGAGGLHVCALADAMGMTKAIVPAHAGVLSALGMLVASQGRQFSRTVRFLENKTDQPEIQLAIESLIEMGKTELMSEGMSEQWLVSEPSVDVCYNGQSSTLNIVWSDKNSVVEQFHRLHLERYGFALNREVEIVNIRTRIVVNQDVPDISSAKLSPSCNNFGDQMVYAQDGEFPTYHRTQLSPGKAVVGPAIVTEDSATTFIEEGWTANQDNLGNIWLAKNA
jgi:N-methylhydantoinase A